MERMPSPEREFEQTSESTRRSLGERAFVQETNNGLMMRPRRRRPFRPARVDRGFIRDGSARRLADEAAAENRRCEVENSKALYDRIRRNAKTST